MYALVMWIGDEPTTSVIPWTEVEVTGKKTRAKWGPKYWPVQVLRQSEDKAWLESLSVIANGQVLWSRSVDLDTILKNRSPSSEDKDDSDLGDLDTVTKSPSSPEASDHADDKSTVNDLDGSEKSEDGSITDSDSTTEKKQYTKDETTQTQCIQEYSGLPKITPEILEFMDCFTTLMKSQLAEKSKSNTPVKAAVVIPPVRKTELLPGSDLWIPTRDLREITEKWYGRPKEMVRRLMLMLLKKEELRNMTPMGKSLYQPIPKHIFLAVEAYVNEKAHPNLELSRTEYTRCLNLMCCNLRSSKLATSESDELPQIAKRITRSHTVVDEESDSSADDCKKRRVTRNIEAAHSSKNESKSVEEKNKRAPRQKK